MIFFMSCVSLCVLIMNAVCQDVMWLFSTFLGGQRLPIDSQGS